MTKLRNGKPAIKGWRTRRANLRKLHDKIRADERERCAQVVASTPVSFWRFPHAKDSLLSVIRHGGKWRSS